MSAQLSAPSTPVLPVASARGYFRWSICALLFLAVTINYIDRQIIGILKAPLSQELGWKETDYASIVAWFQYAYACGYLFGGRLMDGLGVKRGLPFIVFFWSLAGALHGAVRSVTGFMGARAALGLSQGGVFPGAIKAIAEWFPAKERALATGIFNSGTNIGAIICPLLVPWLATKVGWQNTFLIAGSLGVFWIIAWALLYDAPATHRFLSPAERAYILDGATPTAAQSSSIATQGTAASGFFRGTWETLVGWLKLMRFRAVWAYLIASILAGPVWPFYLFFLPDFLQKRYKLTLVEVGNWIAVFYLVASFGGVLGGWLSSRLIGRGWSINAARKIALLVCALSVLPVFFAPSMPAVWLTVLIVGIAGSAHQGWSANLFSFVSDTMPKSAIASVVGMGGFVAFFTGGLISKYVVGPVLETTGSYVLIFAGASLMYVSSLLALHLLVPKINPVADVSAKI